MATIGTFERIGDSEYLGDIFTLSLRAKNVRIVSVSRTNENAPSHRIYIDQVEVGAGWSKRSPEGRDYLSVKLDDPSFNAPIYANLVHDQGAETCSLIWSRPNRRQATDKPQRRRPPGAIRASFSCTACTRTKSA
jgi:uncharacterized protein (DUF736 family)